MIVDGHNDLVLRMWRGDGPLHIDLATATTTGFAGGFFALWIPWGAPFVEHEPPYDVPLAEPVPRDDARRIALELADVFETLPVSVARSVADFAPGHITAIMHLEGAEPLAPDLSDLEQWYARGLRSLGIVWSRRNAFGEGVPFRFPSVPDTGPGLTAAGRDLVAACNRLGILVDVSHLNEAGFWDVARVTDSPIVATHSNAHALCASSRNLTDDQLDAVAATGGVVGVNFAVGFLRADGRQDPDTPLTEIVRHVNYLVDRMGIDHVAFGSDFDGATVPDVLGGVEGLPALLDALRSSGHDEVALAKLASGNWLRVLAETWHSVA